MQDTRDSHKRDAKGMPSMGREVPGQQLCPDAEGHQSTLQPTERIFRKMKLLNCLTDLSLEEIQIIEEGLN